MKKNYAIFAIALLTFDFFFLRFQETRESINRHVVEFGDQLKRENEAALIIDGKTLIYALTPDLRKDFLDLCISCKSVICCRVSPSQKAEVSDLFMFVY